VLETRQDKAVVTCPRCGHQQTVSKAAFSEACKKCGQYWRVQELLKPPPKAAPPVLEQKQTTCFDCGASFEVPVNAQSTMCKRCSCYIDLHDYDISQAVSRNFKTRGSFIIEPSGYVFNTEAFVGEAVIKGKFLGKLVAERSLTIYTTAEVKGSLTAGHLVIPAGQRFIWDGEFHVGTAEIGGELEASIRAQNSVLVRAKGRLFGSITARSLIAETGAVVIGNARFGVTSSLDRDPGQPPLARKV